MSIIKDIHSEKAKLVKCVYRSKLGQKINDNILFPILDKLEVDIPIIMDQMGQWTRNKIQEYLFNSVPSGRTYEIWELDPDAPRGQKAVYVDSYTASAPGEPPARLTETLIESIEYKIFSDGSFRVGLLKNWGEYSNAMTELESAFFAGNKIFIGKTYNKSKTPVGTYGRILGDDLRPWFREFMDSIREELRQRIRNNIKKSLNKATRKISAKRAFVFKVYFR